MNILVTGGSGLVGKGVVKYLVACGHQVRSLDQVTRETTPGVEYVECDITDYPALREQARGMEAIVHLAAYPTPAHAKGPEIFRVNCDGTYNVYEAAAEEGIRRVSSASSINALGFHYGIKSFPLHYFPMDEVHPTYTTDPYSFSKQTLEAIADYYWRREGISGVSLRMPGVYVMTPEMVEMSKKFGAMMEPAFQALIDTPEPERSARVRKMKARLEEDRKNRVSEKPWDPEQASDADMMTPENLLLFGYTDFWALISVEDTAQAFEKSLLAEYEGSHPLYICEAENFTGMPSEDLLKVFYPEVTARKGAIHGAANVVSYDRARELIGFEPKYLIRTRTE